MPGLNHSPTKVLVAVEGSIQHGNASTALHWAAGNLCDPGNELHLVTVLPPSPVPPPPVGPLAAVEAVAREYKEHCARTHDRAANNLSLAAAKVMVEAGVPMDAIHAHVLPPAGGATGVAQSLAEFAQKAHMDMVVMGTRGHGSFTKSLLSLVGLGSVSDCCIHNLHTPIIVVRPDARVEETSVQARTVCVAYDDSPYSYYALTWALQHLLRQQSDTLHIITVAAPVPCCGVERSPASVSVEYLEWQTANKGSRHFAQFVASKAGERAVKRGWDQNALVTESLAPEGGAGGVALSIAHYADEHKVDLLVVGARGLGSFKRSAIMSLVGLGSVSNYLVHNITSCPVAVVKAQEPRLLSASSFSSSSGTQLPPASSSSHSGASAVATGPTSRRAGSSQLASATLDLHSSNTAAAPNIATGAPAGACSTP